MDRIYEYSHNQAIKKASREKNPGLRLKNYLVSINYSSSQLDTISTFEKSLDILNTGEKL